VRTLKRFILPTLWLGVFLITIWIRRDDVDLAQYSHMVLARPEMVGPSPAGEVVAGFHLEQPINWALLNQTILEKEAVKAVCVSYLLANYNDRDNDGTFALSLRIGANQHRVVVNAKKVRDNAYHRICYEDVIFGDIANKPAILVLEGIDSQPGKAITAWMTKDTLHGAAVRQDEIVTDTSLAFRVETIGSGCEKGFHAIILTLICGLSGALIFWAVSGRAANDVPEKPIQQKDSQ
jgi:hypothetical protein